MGRCCNGLMIAFRVVQLILSIVALACAAYITYSMMSLADSAHDLQNTIDLFVNATEPSATSSDELRDLHDGLRAAQKVLDPILKYFQDTPSRAITLTAVSTWSIVVIVYLLLAQNRAGKTPGMNKRSLRVALELLTLILWIAGIICATLLAVQYGPLGILGGSETKLFTTVLRKAAAKKVADSASPNTKVLGESISFVDDLLTIGILAILAAGAAFICGSVSLVSCIAACCISGKATPKQPKIKSTFYDVEQKNVYDEAAQPLQSPAQKDVVYAVQQVSTPDSWHSVPTNPVSRNQGYHTVSTYDMPMAYDQRDGRPAY